MATHFRANQYENAFKAFKLGNWEVPSNYRETPRKREGCTEIIATDRGHLYDGMPRSRENPWGNFVGTWDLPKQIPGNTARVTTARTSHAQMLLQQDTQEAERVLTGKKKNDMRTSYKAMGHSKSMLANQAAEQIAESQRSGAMHPGSKMMAGAQDSSPHEEAHVEQDPDVPGTPVRMPGPQENRSPSPPATPQAPNRVIEN